MQPREDRLVRALAWMITCDSDLKVTIAVVDKYILLRSESNDSGLAGWRIGAYLSTEEAARKAIDMTSSYERLRHGEVGAYAEISLPEWEWEYSVKENSVHLAVSNMIEHTLKGAVLAGLD